LPEQHEHEAREPGRRLYDFIRASQDSLIGDWSVRVRRLSPAKELPRPILIDHLPEILARIADMVESVDTGAQAPLAEAPKQHALDRLARGFDLEEVIKEYSLLRQCILEEWEERVGPSIIVSDLRRLDSALDQSISESTVNFARARERMLKAVNQIAEAALGTSNLDAFLQRILQATLETTEAVDTVAILLREGDLLRMRAAVGIEEDVSRGFTLKVGEGFAGRIAAEAQPLLLRDAAADPIVSSQSIREKGVRALYGIPLSHADSVIGVAYLGSRTAYEFSEEDKLLFRTMASRATSVIVQTQLVINLEKAIHDRDRLVSQLAGERTRLEQILNQIPTGVLIAEAPRAELSFLNKRCQEILGQRLGPAEPASHYHGWRLFHMSGIPYELDETPLYRALRGEEVVDEFKVHRPDGSWVVARAHAAPVREHAGRVQSAIVAFEDISAQKRYEEMLRFLSEASRQLAESIEYEATLNQIARLAVPGIADWFAVDLLNDGELSSVAVAHADPAKMELAKQYRSRFPPDLRGTRGVAKVLRDGQPDLFEEMPDEFLVSAAHNDEHLRLMRELGMRSAMVVPLRVQGRTVGAVSFVSAESARRFDRSDLEIAQGLADRAAMAIENARLFREAERAIHLREDVLAVVSHDLRNPLSTINMSTELLINKAPETAARKQLETILRASGRMERLIGDLLDMASIQAGRLSVERETQEIAPIITEAIETARPLAIANEQKLSAEIAVGSARCYIDRERILQLMSNLLGNAKKFSPSGGTIAIRATVSGKEAACSISDTGPGISEHDMPQIFDPYWSAKHAQKKGIGLGLYISKGIVEAHGGRIWVENRAGGGAIFYFTLPLA
jgi:PAS domain S-box-containing protein